MKVTINGGHCPGEDSGATNPITGLQEANVTHDVMQRVMYYLQQVNYETIQVQENELYQITNASNAFGADLCVSIHCNSATNTSARGTEIFTTKGETEADPLATCIMNQISSAFPDLPVRADYDDGDVDKEENFYVLRYTDCPAVLIELAFINNEDDEKLLASDQGKDDFSRAIARGITDYCSGI